MQIVNGKKLKRKNPNPKTLRPDQLTRGRSFVMRDEYLVFLLLQHLQI
jgi:hypothetical protein